MRSLLPYLLLISSFSLAHASETIEPTFYLRIPNPWELLSEPNFLGEAKKNNSISKPLSTLKTHLSEKVFLPLSKEAGPLPDLILQHLNSSLQVWGFLDPHSPVPMPTLVAQVEWKGGENADNPLLKALSDLPKGIEWEAKQEGPYQKGSLQGQTILSSYHAPSGKLTFAWGGENPAPTLESFLKHGTDRKLIASSEAKVDSTGEGFFLWVNGQKGLPHLAMINPAIGMSLGVAGLDQTKSLSLGWGRSEGLGKLRLYLETPKRGFLGQLPPMKGSFDLHQRGETRWLGGLLFPLKECYKLLQQQLSLFNPPVLQDLRRFEGIWEQSTDISFSSFLSFFGPEIYILGEDSGDVLVCRLSNEKKLETFLSSLEEKKFITRHHIKKHGRTFYHLSLKLNEVNDYSTLPFLPALFFSRLKEHLYYTIENGHLVLASTPQGLFDRYSLPQGKKLSDWLSKDQGLDFSNSLFYNTFNIDHLHRKLYELWVTGIVLMSDLSESEINPLLLPSAKDLQLPQEGRFGFSFQLPEEGLALEFGFEHSPVDALFQVQSGPLVVLGTAAVVAGIAIPTLATAREAANSLADIESSKVIPPKKEITDLNQPRIKVDQPIIISVPTTEMATEFRHLAVKLVVLVGRVGDEKSDPTFDLSVQLKEEQFLETAENFKPWINDRVNKIASDYSYQELQKESTRTEFKKRLKNELNDILKSYGMQPRFQEVLFTSFIFSD